MSVVFLFGRSVSWMLSFGRLYSEQIQPVSPAAMEHGGRKICSQKKKSAVVLDTFITEKTNTTSFKR